MDAPYVKPPRYGINAEQRRAGGPRLLSVAITLLIVEIAIVVTHDCLQYYAAVLMHDTAWIKKNGPNCVRHERHI